MIKLVKYHFCVLLFLVLSVYANAAEKRMVNEQNVYDPAVAREKNIKIWNQFNEEYHKKWKVEWNRITGTPHRIYGHNIQIPESITKKDVDKATRKILKKLKDLLQIEPDQLILSKADYLEPTKSSKSHGTWYIYFTQTYQGIPVPGGSVRLTIRDKKLTMLSSDFYPEINLSPVPVVPKQDAIQIVLKDLSQQQPLMPEDVKLVILPRPLSGVIHYRLAWQITTPVIRVSKYLLETNPLGVPLNGNNTDEKIPVQWSYFVDAKTGSVIDRVNLVLNQNLTGTVTGMVYPSNPSDAQVQVPIAGTTLTLTQGSTEFTAESGSNGQYLFTGLSSGLADLEAHLKGPNVRIYNNETPDPDATHSLSVAIPGSHNWNWSFDDPSPNDVETNAYYHIKFIRDWFLRGGPFNLTPVSPRGEVGNFVRAFVRDGYYCSAYALTGGGTLLFGNGYQSASCRDHALCSDIIYHEYGHLVIQQVYDDAQLSLLGNIEGSAMHEAFADYFAMSITDNPILGDGCVSGGWRNIDTPDNRYPVDFNENAHDDGTIIAGAVWDIRKTLGKDYTDNLAFRALKQVPTSFSEYLGALIEEDDDPLFNSNPTANNNPGDGTPNINLICQAFFDVHGIYHDYCANRTESPVAIVTSPSPLKSSLNSINGSVSVIPIIGTAQGSLFRPLQNFTLEYANERELNLWLTAGITLSGGGTAPVEGGTLGEWNISGIEDGYYLIRLRVTDVSNRSSSTIVNVLIDRGLTAGWPKELDNFFIASPAVADLDPAYPGLEVIARERWGTIFAWHSDGTPVPGWPQRIDGNPTTSPAIGDLDGDGQLEVVAAGGDKIHVFRKDGTVMTGWPQICSGTMGREVTPVISDLNQDGKYEVVTATSTGNICAFYYDGTPVAGWPVALNIGVESAIAVGDLDRDGDPEIVVGTKYGTVYALRNDGSVLTGWPQAVQYSVAASPVLGDIDGDGYLEVIVGSPSGVYAWHYDGTLVSGWPQYLEYISSGSIVLADIDRDGYIEVVLQSQGKIYIWRGNGTALPWSPYIFNCISCSFNPESPIIGDIDGDGKMEIVAMADFWSIGSSWPQIEEFGDRTVNKLIAINDNGTAVLNWPKYVPSIYSASPPLMADIDQDGNTEIIIGGSGVFIWDTPFSYSNDAVEWPAYRHDNRRTGSYPSRLPDLVIESLTHSPANPTAVDLITFTAVVKNIGPAPAGPSILTFKVGEESTPKIYSVPALPPKQTYVVQRQETLGVAQNYMNTVTVDVNSEIQEIDESNNQQIEYYTVLPAFNDYQKPQAIIMSPTRHSLTDAEMLTVTGTAKDNIGIASVTVNGVAAVSSDGFATWSAVVPLNPGNNTLNVIVRDVSGNVVPNADSVMVNRQNNLLVNPISVALDSAINRALVIPTHPTGTLKELLAVDLSTGERTVISGEGIGRGIEFGAPQDLVLDSADNRVLITDWVLHGIISVDLSTGNRSIISDSAHGTGPYLNGPRNLVLDAANNLVFVTDSDWSNPPSLIAVELLNGNRSVISGPTIGKGPDFSFPRGVVLDQANHRALVIDPGSRALYAVDLFNGDRTVISDNTNCFTCPKFSYPNELAFDAANNRVLVVDPNVEAILSVDLSTGNRAIVSGQSIGTGPRISDSFDIALDTSTGMAFVVDQDLDALVSVDLATGNRAIVSGMPIGSGSTFSAPSGIAVDGNNERAFVADFGMDALVVVDLITGSRTVVSNSTKGSGPQFADPYGIVYDAAKNRVLAVDGTLKALLAINLANGNRTIISGASPGGDPAFNLPFGLAYDPDRNEKAFVTDINLNAVVAVDLVTGQRTVISGAERGSGDSLSYPAGIAFHPAGNRVIVANNATNQLIAVELATGDRTVISDDITCTGPTFSSEGDMRDLAIDNANERVLVSVGDGTLFAVDLTTGNRTIISGPNKGNGIRYGEISRIAFDSVHKTVVVTDSVFEGLTLIETGSGDRVIISK